MLGVIETSRRHPEAPALWALDRTTVLDAAEAHPAAREIMGGALEQGLRAACAGPDGSDEGGVSHPAVAWARAASQRGPAIRARVSAALAALPDPDGAPARRVRLAARPPPAGK